MVMDIVNVVITFALLVGLMYCARWIYLTGVKDGRAQLKAEIELEKTHAEIAALNAALKAA